MLKRTASQPAEADCRPQPQTGEVGIDKLEGHTSSGSVMFSKATLVHPVPLHDPGDIASKIRLSVIVCRIWALVSYINNIP